MKPSGTLHRTEGIQLTNDGVTALCVPRGDNRVRPFGNVAKLVSGFSLSITMLAVSKSEESME